MERTNVGINVRFQAQQEQQSPYARILHQPTKYYRMRYEAENRKSFLYSNHNETILNDPSRDPESIDGFFPQIELVNCQGPATLIVSCVNKEKPYHVNPHKLVGDTCSCGVACIKIKHRETIFDVSGITILYPKRNEIEPNIRERKEKNVDPFNVGFDFDRNKIDLSKTCLAFQVFLEDERKNLTPLPVLVSNVIENSINRQDKMLKITETENMHAKANGGDAHRVVIVLKKKLEKEHRDLRAKFFDSNGWQVVVPITQILHQSILLFRAPPYKDISIKSEVAVQLKVFIPFINEEERDKYLREADRMDMDSHLDVDGKHESELLEFLYKPSDIPFEMELLNTDMFFTRPNEQVEFTNDISNQARSNLAKRQEELNLALISSRNSEYIINPVLVGWNDNYNTEEMIDLESLN